MPSRPERPVPVLSREDQLYRLLIKVMHRAGVVNTEMHDVYPESYILEAARWYTRIVDMSAGLVPNSENPVDIPF